MLNVVSYNKILITLVVVPVNNTTCPVSKDELKNRLNQIYAQAIVDFNVTFASNFDVNYDLDGDGKLKDKGKETFSSYTDEMNAVINAYAEKNSIKKQNLNQISLKKASEPKLLGDYDMNSEVDLYDLSIFKQNYGKTSTAYDIGPASTGTKDWEEIYCIRNGDKKISVVDLIVFTVNFGKIKPVEEKVETEFIFIEAGKTSEENGSVEVLEDFYIGKYEVTQKQFEEIMGYNSSNFVWEGSENNPVDQSNWYEAITYCNKLSEREGLGVYYNIENIEYYTIQGVGIILGADVTENEGAKGYRLPTKIEWEYAARGGKNGLNTLFPGGDILAEVGWYRDISEMKTHPVGEKKPNELGIYDMAGNVIEWTNTFKDEFILVCGGSAKHPEGNCVFDNISTKGHPANRYDGYYGFRIAKNK